MLAAVALAASAQQPPASTPSIRLVPGQGDNLHRAAFDLIGLDAPTLQALRDARWDDARWRAAFAVAVDRGGVLDAFEPLPMAGRYEIRKDAVRFTPRFPLEGGLRYRATLHPDRLPGPAGEAAGGPISALFSLPPPRPGPAPRLLHVDPPGDRLPENLLRLYLHFNTAMSRGEVYDRVRLLDPDGRPIAGAFLELGEELWDPPAQRLSLLIDPGRIKRGLRPRDEDGPILEAGKTYTLVVDAGWPDSAGQPLAQGLNRRFEAAPADTSAPDPAAWTLTRPAAHTRQVLAVDFHEPLDTALAMRVLTVLGPDGQPVPGAIALAPDAASWRFTPGQPWAPGSHRLHIDRTLEDLAGNQVGRPFEVDITGPITDRVEPEFVDVPFTVK